MKKIFLFFAAFLPMICSAQTDQSLYEGEMVAFIPKPISATNGARCVTVSDETAYLYDNQFQFSKSIPLTGNERVAVSQSFSKPIIGYSYTFYGDKSFLWDLEKLSISEFKSYIEERDGRVYRFCHASICDNLDSIFVTDGTMNINPQGDTVYSYFYGIEDGYLYEAYNVYFDPTPIYSESFSDTPYRSDTAYHTEVSPNYYEFINADLDTQSDLQSIFINQTLFNSDDSYEYLRFIYGDFVEKYTNSPSMGYEYHKNLITPAVGFEVVSETGNVIQSVTFNHGFSIKYHFYLMLVKIDDIYYLLFPGSTSTSDDAILVYRVNRGSTSPVQEIAAPLPTSVTKYIRSGHLFINDGKHVYSATGLQVK